MAKLALYGEMKVRPGKEAEVEAFLKQAAEMAAKESGTISWYAIREDKPGTYGIFDTFDDEKAREAHLGGPIAQALMSKSSEYFTEPPKIRKISLVAEKV